MELLTDDQITAELSETPGWTLAGSEISRTVQRQDFKDAMIFVGGVAFLAEEANHHPDILVQWNKVTLTLFDAFGRRPHRGRFQHGPAHLRARLSRPPPGPGPEMMAFCPSMAGSERRSGPGPDKLIVP